MLPAKAERLIQAALAIDELGAKDSNSLGYMARVFAQVSLPHSRVEGNTYKRSNGVLSLVLMSDPDTGVPYGSYPRLLMSWITTEAVRTKTPHLLLGHTLSGFMDSLGLLSTGGRWGTIPRLKDQMQRLFTSTVSCRYSDDSRTTGLNMSVVRDYDLWWQPHKPEQGTLWESTLTLSRDFFDEIVSRPVPIDTRVLKAIKKSPMKLDIYCWLTHRMSYLSKPVTIPWEVLSLQFGSNYAEVWDFKRRFLDALKDVLYLYPEAKVTVEDRGLFLKPSKTHVIHKTL